MRAAKLVDGIKLERKEKEYDSAKVIFNLDNFNALDYSSLEETPVETLKKFKPTATLEQTKARDTAILDKLCTSCIGSKSTQIVRNNKSMTAITNKLQKVHIDFEGLHDPPFQSRSTYATILICEHIQKTWMIYLQKKNNFVDAFKIWLPHIKAKSEYFMKTL